MIPIDHQVMLEIAPHFSGKSAERQAVIVAEVGEVLQSTLEEYEIATRLRIAHFLAQTCHESAGFSTTEEFATGGAYEGRSDLGNVKPGDGRRYKGRGLLQLTGRANYAKLGAKLGVNLEEDPEQAAEPKLSLRIACEYWKQRNINRFCDEDDLIRVTKLINGGLNGLDQRRAFTTKAKTAIARIEGFQISANPPAQGHSVLRRGSKGEEVAQLQSILRKLGFEVAVDGAFGPGTEVAVARLQSDNKVCADGIVGQETWALLDAEPA
jgi:putative chitinase